MDKYRIYGKLKGSKRFQAYDAKNGLLVKNLIYASLFDDEGQTARLVDELNRFNPDYEFQHRLIRGC